MNRQKEKTAWLVAAAVLVVVGVLVLLFRLIFRDQQESAITLPAQTAAAPAEEPEQEAPQAESRLITVTPENLDAFLGNLTAPDAYCQTFTITLTAGDAQRVRQVRLWKNQDETKAVIIDETAGTEKHLLRREDGFWLWYAGDSRAVQMTEPQASLEALCSLPDREQLLDQWTGKLTETTYATLDSGEAAILVRGEDGSDGLSLQISADTGLVLNAQRWDDSGQWYEAAQTEYRLLTPADAEYTAAFTLPQEE